MASTREMHLFPSLAVEELQLSDVESIFHLSQASDADWTQFRAPFEIPDDCKSVLSITDASGSLFDGKRGIVLLLRLGILLTAVHSTLPDPRSPGLHPIPISSKCRLSCEPVVYKGKKRCLTGFPDYSLWYGSFARKESVAVNSIIVETEKGQSTGGVPQAIAYMGMIHAQRRYEGKLEHTVFGLSTDHDQFHFLQINTEGEWSQLDLNYSSHRQEIVETLAYFHMQASILSTFEHSDGSENASSESHVENDPHGTSGLDKSCLVFHMEDDLDPIENEDEDGDEDEDEDDASDDEYED